MRRTKNFFVRTLSIAMLFAMAVTFVIPVHAEEISRKSNDVQVTVIKIDDLNFEMSSYNRLELNSTGNKFKVISSTFSQNNDDENEKSFTAGYEIFIPLQNNENEISPMNIDGSSKDEAGVKAELYVDYDISANNEQVRVNRVYGSWKPGNMYYLTDRVVGCHSGINFYKPRRFEEKVYSNSFNFKLNWGYVDRTWGDASPRAWSEATVKVSGMGGSHRIEIMFPFS